MILPMLRAVDAMLIQEGSDNVKCARNVLAEIIKHLEEGVAPEAVYTGTMTSGYVDADLDPDAASAQEELTGENSD